MGEHARENRALGALCRSTPDPRDSGQSRTTLRCALAHRELRFATLRPSLASEARSAMPIRHRQARPTSHRRQSLRNFRVNPSEAVRRDTMRSATGICYSQYLTYGLAMPMRSGVRYARTPILRDRRRPEAIRTQYARIGVLSSNQGFQQVTGWGRPKAQGVGYRTAACGGLARPVRLLERPSHQRTDRLRGATDLICDRGGDNLGPHARCKGVIRWVQLARGRISHISARHSRRGPPANPASRRSGRIASGYGLIFYHRLRSTPRNNLVD